MHMSRVLVGVVVFITKQVWHTNVVPYSHNHEISSKIIKHKQETHNSYKKWNMTKMGSINEWPYTITMSFEKIQFRTSRPQPCF